MSQIYVAFDLELTGLDTRDEIIEIAAVKFDRRREFGRFQTLVRPTVALPLHVERMTGLRRGDLARAPSFAEVRERFVQFVGAAPLVGQSAPRDVAILARHGLALSNPVFDTFELASILLPDLPSYSLSAIAGRLGIPIPKAHRALPDALVAKEVFLALLEIGAQLDLRTLSEIVQLTRLTEWPLRLVFQDLERERRRDQQGVSLAAVLESKGALDLTNVDFLSRGERDAPIEPMPGPADKEPLSEVLDPQRAPAGTALEYRPEQIAMLQSVSAVLENGGRLIVEAGTGTGKSLAYLLPSAEWAIRNGGQVVVSTKTLTLQDQLVKQDIPRVEALLAERDRRSGGPVRRLQTAVVKGRTNYLCLRRWGELRRAQAALTLDEVKVLCRILVWLPQTPTGDRAELNLSPGEQSVWSRISAQTDDCLIGTCTFQKRGTCFLYRARRHAEHAHLIVVNHALLLSDLEANGSILPPASHLIIDEAHHLEDEATRQFGFAVSRRDLLRHLDSVAERRGRDRWLGLAATVPAAVRAAAPPPSIAAGVATLIAELSERADTCRASVEALAAAVAAFAKTPGEDGDTRRRLTESARADPRWQEVVAAWEPLARELRGLGGALSRLQAVLAPLSAGKEDPFADLLLEVMAQLRLNAELNDRLSRIIPASDPALVTWVETAAGEQVLCAAPLEVAELLANKLFAKRESVVLTSATLSADNSFAFLRQRLGLDRATEVQLGSPFNFAERARVLVPSDPEFPEPNQRGYDTAVADVLVRTAIASEGRMLALFTSNAALRRIRSLVRPALEKENIVVLGQNVDGARTQLLNTLREHPRTVILGTASFWEGIDIPGDALSVLVIARLPFGVPSDPLFAARQESFADGFTEFAVPHAILRFRQGFGRLIRSKHDRGVAIVLDRRICTKAYGAAFRRSLPCPVELIPAAEIPARTLAFLQSCSP
ncbi:MAG: helicase C-terminal domain-containing protein [Chloroflexota bacterium]|nr:exonuclease domain-containing protein [Dehalococcoidia bacterium]MDW8253218.1 helicase C-terminal domain-containing protein [Chloroflexota bacterium]